MDKILKDMDQVNQLIQNTDKVIILCKTHECGVCLSIEARFKKEHDLLSNWHIAHVYVDDLALFRGEHSVFTVPTVLMFFEGKEIYRSSRFIDFNKIQYFIEILD